jgi:hypothetical protein
MANHYRGVQDIGVSKYAGRAWFAAAILIALVVTLVGAGLATACNKRSLGAECIVGGILLFLGLAVLAVAAIIVLAAIGSVIPPPSQPVNPADCPSGRVCVGIDGSVGCCAD